MPSGVSIRRLMLGPMYLANFSNTRVVSSSVRERMMHVLIPKVGSAECIGVQRGREGKKFHLRLRRRIGTFPYFTQKLLNVSLEARAYGQAVLKFDMYCIIL